MKRDAILMVVLAILILGIGALSYMFYTDSEELRVKLETKTAEFEASEKAKRDYIEQISKISRYVGWYSEGRPTDLNGLQESVREIVGQFPKEWAEFMENNLLLNDQQDKSLVRVDAVLRFQHSLINVRNEIIAEQKTTIDGQSKRIADNETQMQELRDTFLSEQSAAQRSQETVVKGLNSQILQLENDLRNERESHENDVQSLTDQRNTVSGEVRERDSEIAKLKNELKRRDEALSVNLKTVEVEADGRVVHVADDFSTVYIDLSKENRVYPGLIFEVFREKKDGSWHLKGSIEIKKVMDTMSEARIIDMNSIEYPIMADDLIVNPVFNPDKTYHIAFVGSLSGNSAWNETMLKSLITDSGGVFDGTVTAQTDFVVILGEPTDDDLNWVRTRQFNKQVMTATEFTRLFGR